MKKRQIGAILSIILILGLYALSLIFALMDSPLANSLLMSSLFCTIVIPVWFYILMHFGNLFHRKEKEDEEQ